MVLIHRSDVFKNLNQFLPVGLNTVQPVWFNQFSQHVLALH